MFQSLQKRNKEALKDTSNKKNLKTGILQEVKNIMQLTPKVVTEILSIL